MGCEALIFPEGLAVTCSITFLSLGKLPAVCDNVVHRGNPEWHTQLIDLECDLYPVLSWKEEFLLSCGDKPGIFFFFNSTRIRIRISRKQKITCRDILSTYTSFNVENMEGGRVPGDIQEQNNHSRNMAPIFSRLYLFFSRSCSKQDHAIFWLGT